MKHNRYSERENQRDNRDNSNSRTGRMDSARSERSQYGRSGSSYNNESQRNQDWYNQDPMDERSGYRSDDSNISRYSTSDRPGSERNYNDREFDRYSQRSPSSWGSGQSYNYNQKSDYGSGTHTGEDYGRQQYGSDRSGSERYNQQNDYGNSSGYGSEMNNRSFDRSYDYSGRQNSSFRPQGSSERSSYQGRQDQGGMDYDYSPSRNRQSRQDRGNSYDYDRFANASSQEPYADQWQAYGTMDRNSSSSDAGRTDRERYSGRGPKSFKRSDERIQDEICEMLTRNGEIDADDIDVQVKEGEVTLTGTVTERRMKHLVEDSVERCFGVKEVTNNLRVKKSDSGLFSSNSYSSEMNASSSKNSGNTGKKSSSSAQTSSSNTTDSVKNPNH